MWLLPIPLAIAGALVVVLAPEHPAMRWAMLPGLVLWFPLAVARLGPEWLPAVFNGAFYYLLGVAGLALARRDRPWPEVAAVVVSAVLVGVLVLMAVAFGRAEFD